MSFMISGGLNEIFNVIFNIIESVDARVNEQVAASVNILLVFVSRGSSIYLMMKH